MTTPSMTNFSLGSTMKPPTNGLNFNAPVNLTAPLSSSDSNSTFQLQKPPTDTGEREAVFKEMRDIAEKNSFVNAKLNEANEVFTKIIQSHSSDNDNLKFEDILEEYKKEMNKINPDVTKDKNLVEFNRQIEDLLKENTDDAVPAGNDDEDLQFLQDTVNVIDPFTKQRMTDPMKNKKCGHIYDRESVKAVLQVNPRTRCPVVGCGNNDYVSMENLESDIVLKMRLLKKTV